MSIQSVVNRIGSLIKLFLFLTRINRLLSRLIKYPVILGFHHVKQPCKNLLEQRIGVTPPDIFKNILYYLIEMDYKFVTLENLIESSDGRIAVITFDDGYKNLYTDAYPVIKELNIPFTLFLITSTTDSEKLLWLHKLYICLEKIPQEKGIKLLTELDNSDEKQITYYRLINKILGSYNKSGLQKLVSKIENEVRMSKEEECALCKYLYLNKTELSEMQKHGLSIEAHGHEHFPLNHLDYENTKEEVKQCFEFIEKEFQKKPRFYSLAYGSENLYIEDIIKGFRLSGICTSRQNIIESPVNPYKLSRIFPTNLLDFSYFLTLQFLNVLKNRFLIGFKKYICQ